MWEISRFSLLSSRLDSITFDEKGDLRAAGFKRRHCFLVLNLTEIFSIHLHDFVACLEKKTEKTIISPLYAQTFPTLPCPAPPPLAITFSSLNMYFAKIIRTRSEDIVGGASRLDFRHEDSRIIGPEWIPQRANATCPTLS